MSMLKMFNGKNDDMYDGIGKIWQIAHRHNQKSIEINGAVTCVKRRKVSKDEYEPVSLR
jgi:hypothetical protein